MMEDMLAVLQEYPEAKAISAATMQETPNGMFRQPEENAVLPKGQTCGEVDYFKASLHHAIAWVGKNLFAREVFDHVGMFNPDLFLGPDIDMWARIAGAYRWYFSDKAVSIYHYYPGSIYNNSSASQWFIDGVFPFKDKEAYLLNIDESRREDFLVYREHFILFLAARALINGDFRVVRMLLRAIGFCPRVVAWWPIFIVSHIPFLSLLYKPFRPFVYSFLLPRMNKIALRFKKYFS